MSSRNLFLHLNVITIVLLLIVQLFSINNVLSCPTSMKDSTLTTGKNIIPGKIIGHVPYQGDIDLYQSTSNDSVGTFSFLLTPGNIRKSTDSSGRFIIADVSPGKYKIKFTLQGKITSFKYPDICSPWMAMPIKTSLHNDSTSTGVIIISSVFEIKSDTVI
jgi:hypothetical protein